MTQVLVTECDNDCCYQDDRSGYIDWIKYQGKDFCCNDCLAQFVKDESNS